MQNVCGSPLRTSRYNIPTSIADEYIKIQAMTVIGLSMGIIFYADVGFAFDNNVNNLAVQSDVLTEECRNEFCQFYRYIGKYNTYLTDWIQIF